MHRTIVKLILLSLRFIYIFRLACACAKKAKEGGYVAFALGYYGECHGAKNRESYDAWLKSEERASNDCINQIYGKCSEGDEKCVGGANAEYVYTFPSQAPEGNLIVSINTSCIEYFYNTIYLIFLFLTFLKSLIFKFVISYPERKACIMNDLVVLPLS